VLYLFVAKLTKLKLTLKTNSRAARKGRGRKRRTTLATIRRDRDNRDIKGDIRHLVTTFGGGKIAVRTGHRPSYATESENEISRSGHGTINRAMEYR